MNATLSFDANRAGVREFAEMVAALQEAGARFSVDRSGARLLVTVDNGEEEAK